MGKFTNKVVKKTLGTCGTCGKPNDPRHTCRVRFTPTNAARMAKRQERKGR